MLDTICLGIIKYLPSTNLFRSEEIIYIYLDVSRIYPYYIFRSEEITYIYLDMSSIHPLLYFLRSDRKPFPNQ